MKACIGCGAVKCLEDFPPNARRKDGRIGRCRACVRAYENARRRGVSRREEYLKGRSKPGVVERQRAYSRAWREANPERSKKAIQEWTLKNAARKRATDRAWQQANPEKMREYRRKHAKKNPDKWNAYGAKRRAQKLRATPPWLTPEQHQEMNDWYALAAAIGYEVDHIIPLAGKSVCGLHVPWNLQLLSTEENRSKGNRHES